eukprot:gnl/TRDRNA2_/TRDRNA2_91916_c0_seq1.p1 gnl/TRDRNA2_/TRDRNA2_91916_c0~~gnl/TRDRNA2_/TRDRNA2_91916_c0_seq1.p1  ORF type:complete len:720 (-),score=110.57 gnl/TRDRNA2_/TRDRNA2_91916_c0_seq1:54-2213(-)
MGKCLSSLRATTTPGRSVSVGDDLADTRDGFQGHSIEENDAELLEVRGIPLDHMLFDLGRLTMHERSRFDKMLEVEIQKALSETRKSSSSAAGNSAARKRQARIETITWNVGGLTGTGGIQVEDGRQERVRNILSGVVGTNADVVAFGLQEVISLTVDNAMRNVSSSQNSGFWPAEMAYWVELLQDVVNSKAEADRTSGKSLYKSGSSPKLSTSYVLYGVPVYLFGLLLVVFCRSNLLGTDIQDFQKFEMTVDARNTGVKGAVACRFSLFDRSFCFINCHLQALSGKQEADNLKHLQKRMEQLRRVWESTQFQLANQKTYPMKSHRAVFMFGDTNMRLAGISKQDAKRTEDDIKAEHWESLQKRDQLCQLLSGNEELWRTAGLDPSQEEWWRQGAAEWREPLIDGKTAPRFPPTYKLEVPGPGYSTKRVPAWTDRVLYRSQYARPEAYGCGRQEIGPQGDQVLHNLSDHNPVFARFKVDCMSLDVKRLQHMIHALQDDGTFGGRRSMMSCASEAMGRSTKLDPFMPHRLTAEEGMIFRNAVTQSALPEIERYSHRLHAMLNKLEPGICSEAAEALAEVQDELITKQLNALEVLITNAMTRAVARQMESESDASLVEDLRAELLAKDEQPTLTNAVANPSSSSGELQGSHENGASPQPPAVTGQRSEEEVLTKGVLSMSALSTVVPDMQRSATPRAISRENGDMELPEASKAVTICCAVP